MSKNVSRTLYSFATTLLANETKTSVERGWPRNASIFIEEVLQKIMANPLKQRVYDSSGEWFFYLDNVTVDKREKDPTHQDCIHGWFNWVRIGLRTELTKRSTMGTRENPKEEDESETHRSYFYFRLKDGLFLQDGHSKSVVNHKRVEDYLFKMAPEVYAKYNIRYLSFSHLVSQEFLAELSKYSVIRSARIRLQVTDDATPTSDDFIGQLENNSRSVYANYFDLMVGRKNARKRGLKAKKLGEMLSFFMRDNKKVISGTIEGSRDDGGPDTIKIKGTEEKFKGTFLVDNLGEILQEQMFPRMITIGNSHVNIALA